MTSGVNSRRAARALLVLTLLGGIAWSSYAQTTLQAGYTLVRLDGGTQMPVGTAVFSFTNPDGVLVTEAGVGAVEPIARGRIFVDEVGTRTGVALVNPATTTALVNLVLRDLEGTTIDEAPLVLEPGKHTSKFVDELFDAQGDGFRGSFTFESAAGLGAIALRLSTNVWGEPLFTTLPVVDLDATQGSDPAVFPHLAVGGGYRTQVILINPSGETITGRIRLVRSDGTPFLVNWDEGPASENAYQIEAHGVGRVELSSESGAPEVGYAVVTPETGVAPSGNVIFQLWASEQLVTEAGVGVTPETTRSRISLDNVGGQTGVAIANRSSEAVEVEFILQDRFGNEQDRITDTMPAGGHLSRFAQELFPTLALGFNGLLEIQSSSPVAPITLQLTINTRNEQVLTTLPVADLTRPLTAGMVVFPQIAIGGGYATRLVFLNGETTGVRLEFFGSDGIPLVVPLGSQTSSQFTLALASGEGQRLFPGNTARIASISLRDPVTNLATTEVAVTKGSALRPRVLVVDTLGKARDDFLLNYNSFSPSVAAVSGDGLIHGIGSGFSTLTIDGDGVLATATISVVEFAQATGGFATDVAQSADGTLFVTSTAEHTILSLENLQTTLYAGSHLQQGFLNDRRLLSQFDAPSYLDIDRTSGRLYVSDTENHAIRVVPPGEMENVTTLAGGGVPGFVDGSSDSARFDTPKGVAIDNSGFLWVVDQANHVIRRINLVSGDVQTVAGMPGESGNQDGDGSSARFDTPTGIAIEPESIAEQLLREIQGGDPPPIQVVVSDTGNGLIRRVTENGEVSTVGSGSVATLSATPDGRFRLQDGGVPLTFDSPTGIAVGPPGNIYVIESGSGRLRSILTTGEVVTLAAGGRFDSPNGLVVGNNGEIIVASTSTPLTEIRTASPAITAINPESVSPAGGELLEVHGENFEPDAVLTVAQVPISFTFHDTSLISFVTPVLPSGETSLSVTTRGGVAVAAFTVLSEWHPLFSDDFERTDGD